MTRAQVYFFFKIAFPPGILSPSNHQATRLQVRPFHLVNYLFTSELCSRLISYILGYHLLLLVCGHLAI